MFNEEREYLDDTRNDIAELMERIEAMQKQLEDEA